MGKNLDAERKANAGLRKATLVLAKIAEVLHWGLAVAMLVGAIGTAIWSEQVTGWMKESVLGSEATLSCYGFEMGISGAGSIIGFALGSVVMLALMAMVFRNVYLILKTAQGKTWFSRGKTPFQGDVVRMMREIGIFLIAVAVISLISTIVVSSLGGEIASGFNYLSGFMGLVFICISQFFNYGTGLEKDLDGLV